MIGRTRLWLAGWRIALPVAAYLMTGCSYDRPAFIEGPDRRPRLVFGAIKVLVRGAPRKVGPVSRMLKGPLCAEFVRVMPNSPVVASHTFRETVDGGFSFTVPPGRYAMWRLYTKGQAAPSLNSAEWFQIMASFSVPREAKSVYVGTLAIDFTSNGLDKISRVTVADEFPDRLSALGSEHRQALEPCVKSLMRLEE